MNSNKGRPANLSLVKAKNKQIGHHRAICGTRTARLLIVHEDLIAQWKFLSGVKHSVQPPGHLHIFSNFHMYNENLTMDILFSHLANFL